MTLTQSVPFLGELALIAAVGAILAALFRRIHFSTPAGLLVAGALIGSSGLGVIKDVSTIETLAEIGVMMLLFTLGLEFSLARLRHIAKHVLVGGLLQVGLTGMAIAAIMLATGFTLERAVLYAFILTVSCTAIVLKFLSDRGETDAPHGKFIVGVLIFQDLCSVAMVLLVPTLAGQNESNALLQVVVALSKTVGLVAVTVIMSVWVLPRIFRWIDASRSRDVFLLAVLCVCMGSAWISSILGLSLPLGAFLGGLMLAGSDYGKRAMTDVIPFRDAFTSLFFISLGMLFDWHIMVARPFSVLLLIFGILCGKGIIATIAALAMRFPARIALLAGVALAQFGEFSYILASQAHSLGMIQEDEFRLLLCAGIITMFVTPVAMLLAPHFSAGERLLRPLERILGARGIDEIASDHCTLKQHVLIIGYGVAGQMLARSLEKLAIPYIVLELNAETVRRARAQGKPVYYGDGTSIEALEHAQLDNALAAVIVINDRKAARRIVAVIRRHHPTLPVHIRTRYVADQKELIQLGASKVVYEEFESALRIIRLVLKDTNLSHENVVNYLQNLQDVYREQLQKKTT